MKYQGLTPLILSFAILLHFPSAFAHWKSSTIDLFKKSSEEYVHMQNAGFTSLWGGVKRKFVKTNIHGKEISLKVKNRFKAQGINVYFHEGSEKGPLNIFFPGIFGSYDGNLSPAIISLLEKFPGHVLVIPNFLSETYIKAGPLYNDSPEEFDMNVAIEVIEQIVGKIPDEKIEGLNLFAESLGSFVGAGVLSKISYHKRFIKEKINLTIMWPPSDLSVALKNFDAGIAKTLKKYKECSFVTNAVKVGYYFLYQDVPKNMSKDFVECMESYMYHFAFVKSIGRSFKAYTDTQKVEKKSKPENFKTFFASYNKQFWDLIQKNDPALHIDYWLKKRNLDNSTVRVITSKNDFLNIGIDWNKVIEKSYLGKNSIIILPWGGHSGGLAMPIWEDVLRDEFFSGTQTEQSKI